MKSKLLLLSILLTAAFAAQAQQGMTWIGLDLRAGYGTSYLFNQPSFQDDSVIYQSFNPSQYFGAKLNFLFGQGTLSFGIEGGYSSSSQNFVIKKSGLFAKDEYHKALLSSYHMAFLFKAHTLGGFYVELGPQIDYVIKSYLDQDNVTDKLYKKFYSGVFQFGFMPIINQYIELSIGLRTVASIGSIISDPQFNYYSSSPNSANYSTNSTFRLQFIPMIDLNYVFAYMGRASCGKFRVLLNK